MVVWIIRLPLSRLAEFASRRVVGRSDGERQQGEIRTHQADNQPDNLEIGPHDAPSLASVVVTMPRNGSSCGVLGHNSVLFPGCAEKPEA